MKINSEPARSRRCVVESRGVVVAVGILLLLASTSISLKGAPVSVEFTQSSQSVDTFDFVQITLRLQEPDAPNPFTDAALTGDFGLEGTPAVRVEGFCDAVDGSLYQIRFMPRTAGTHSFSVRFEQAGYVRTHTGSFTARNAGRSGPLRLDPDRPQHFIWEGTGRHYFWNGTTTYYLMGWESDDEIRRIIDRLAHLKINRLRVLVYGRNEDRPWGQPVKSTPEFKLYLNPWPAARPDDVKDPGFDLTRFEVSFWQKYEKLLRHARDRDVVISVIFFIGGQVLPTPFAPYSADEERFYRYGVARFAGFSNVTWDLGNEHNFHREVPRWCDWLGSLVKEWDPYDHLTSAHNVIYRTRGATWNDLQLIQRWDAGQNAFMLGESAKQAASGRLIPQINEEYGYEDLWEKHPGQRAADTRRRLAWEIAFAGCYQTTGETANRGTGFAPDTGGGWVNGRGDDTMTMLDGYARMVDFFTAFDWWRGQPRNELVRGGALCLADPGRFIAVYLPRPATVSLTIEGADNDHYRATWFNPRTGDRIEAGAVAPPVWAFRPPAPEGDWALLLLRDLTATNTAPAIPLAVDSSLSRRELIVTFNRAVDPRHFPLGTFSLEPNVPVHTLSRGEGPNRLRLTTGALVAGTRYTLVTRTLQDPAKPEDALGSSVPIVFEVRDPLLPVVQLRINEAIGSTTVNSGATSTAHPVANLIGEGLDWSTNAPPHGGRSALDFGVNPANRVLELEGDRVAVLQNLQSFTLTGWVNCRDATIGSGGNRILTAINHGGDGFDLVMLADGSLQLGVNEWPDGSPARSSPGQIPVDPSAAASNWRFFAVTYDASRAPATVNFHFGSPEREAMLDTSLTYDRGTIGDDPGPVAVGHFNRLTRVDHADRMFRGLIDEIRIHGSALDGAGALTLPQIRQIQAGDQPR